MYIYYLLLNEKVYIQYVQSEVSCINGVHNGKSAQSRISDAAVPLYGIE
jgi:hypothetical protein